ncbi:MAG: AAA family ATPase [Gammaproteobacteria bacterium]|nr:AAA family ATPase [Gammaproteobacteria bacterium]
MPGNNLNNLEEDLLQFWENPGADFEPALLKAISIEGPPALRGIMNLRVPFNYPLTAISGRNGVGKSTVMALAAFSALKPPSWTVNQWPTSIHRMQPKSMAYNWHDFFFHHAGEPLSDGLTINFAYVAKGDEFDVKRFRSSRAWKTLPDPGRSRTPKFPKRPIEFVPLSRIIPPAEINQFRLRFGKQSKPATIQELGTNICSSMTEIFGREYEHLELHEVDGLRLAKCRSGAHYTGFNMGAGENAAIAILFALLRLPKGGLLLVEEIENGLHPEAQRRLVSVLARVLKERRSQLICSTHSETIIDCLPRQGRILLTRSGPYHFCHDGPTTRFAISEMDSRPHPEATVYVEDNFSEHLVRRALSSDTRKRVRIIAVGNNVRVVRQLAAHIRAQSPGPALCVLDGDCTETEAGKWLRSEDIPDEESKLKFLPGNGLPPEKWAIKVLRERTYLKRFAHNLDIEIPAARDLIQALDALPNHHDCCHELEQRQALSTGEGLSILLSAIALDHPELDEIRLAINTLIEQ